MATKQETREIVELQVEMKHVQQDIKDVKETLKSLPDDLVNRLDERYVRREEFVDVKESVEPITKFRKALYAVVIAETLLLGLYAAKSIL